MTTQEDILFEKLSKVETEQDFLSFFTYFRQYFLENKENLENRTIEDYFEAMEAVIIDLDGYYKNFSIKKENLSRWKIFADILTAATTYE